MNGCGESLTTPPVADCANRHGRLAVVTETDDNTPYILTPPAAGDPAFVEPDRLVRLRATDGYDVHRLIYETFATQDGRDFLYAPFAVAGDLHAVFVRRLDVQTRFVAGMEFVLTLRAMPAVKMAGRRRSIGAARTKDPLRLRWIEARARAHGFTLLAAPEMHIERVRLEAAKRPFGFNACVYRVAIRITDAVRFTRAYTRGIGQGVGLRDADSSRGVERHEYVSLQRPTTHGERIMTHTVSKGDARTKESTGGPALSNYLSVLAVEVAGEFATYKRCSSAAHRAYLTAGATLVEARRAARHGQWTPFLEACGIEIRTARNMMLLARAGFSADDLTAAGGVRGALESLREAAKAVLGRDGELSPVASHADARCQARKHLRDCVVRQRGQCAICERLLPGDLVGVHVDHKRPLADGGTSDPSNHQAVHAICNLVKGARDFYSSGDAS